MSYLVEVLSDLPVVFSRALPGFNMATEQAKLQADVRHALESTTEPLFYIVDLSHIKLDFEAVMRDSNGGARSENSPWRHANIRGVLFVSADELIHRAVEGMNSVAFGNFKATTFNTFDEALHHIRQNI